MSIPRSQTTYKKKEGILTLTEDRKFLIWTPLPATGPPTVSLALDNITNLQQTPPGSAKVILKFTERPRPNAEPGAPPPQYMFQFTHPTDARAEANAIRDLLSQLLAAARENDPNVPKPAAAAGQSGATNGAPAAPASQAPRWFDDAALKADIDLQQSLMKKDKDLAQTYAEALALKPESIPTETFNAQFWSTRVGLLRAHAIELHQKKGAYNVLSTIKPRTEDGQLKLSISPEQIQMILQQHPIVRRIYNDNVPKLSESEFWSRFFLSKLFKKLRGERYTENDNPDPLFDKFLEADNSFGLASKIVAAQKVPHIIDLEANEENQGGFKSGNRKDVEMRPRANVPIIKTLNSLSEKIMANVAPADLLDPDPVTARVPASGLTEDDTRTFAQLSLRDLQGDAETARIILNVREQNQFFQNQAAAAAGLDGQASEDAKVFEQQVPSEVLFDVHADLETLDEDGAGGIDLHGSIGIDDESESDPEGQGTSKVPHVGSRAARKQAQKQILEGMRKKRLETYGTGGAATSSLDDDTSPMSIPPDIAQRCYLTNATTVEFLRQFWSCFLSTAPDSQTANGRPNSSEQMQQLAYYAETLRRSRERIDALAAEAEVIRQQVVERRKREIMEHYERTRRKIRWQPPRGGRESVMALFEATLEAVRAALAVWGAVSGKGTV